MPSYHIRISEASRKQLEQLKRQTGKSFSRLIDEALDVNECTLADEQINNWVKEGEFTSPPKVKPAKTYSPLPKPCPAVIDAQILMCWRHEFTKRSRRKKTAAEINNIVFTRKELIRAVRQKINLGYYPQKTDAPIQLDAKHRTWGEVYPEWFKNNQKTRSKFQVYLDNRLIALVKQGLISRLEDGFFKLSALYPLHRYENEWAVIRGVTLLPPQKGLDIPHIMNASPVGKALKHEPLLALSHAR